MEQKKEKRKKREAQGKKRKERDREPVDKFVVGDVGGRIFHGLLDKDGEGHKIKEALRHDRWSWWSWWW
jgi:hypothetical protein